MNIAIFNKKYWVRRFGEPKNVRGYITSDRKDFAVSLHIHPMGSDAMQALPEGERRMKHLEGHGTDELIPANQETGVKGDLLLYHGEWYECTSAQFWDHTLLSHTNYQFCLVPTNSPRAADITDPPTGEPGKPEDEEKDTAESEKPDGTGEDSSDSWTSEGAVPFPDEGVLCGGTGGLCEPEQNTDAEDSAGGHHARECEAAAVSEL